MENGPIVSMYVVSVRWIWSIELYSSSGTIPDLHSSLAKYRGSRPSYVMSESKNGTESRRRGDGGEGLGFRHETVCSDLHSDIFNI